VCFASSITQHITYCPLGINSLTAHSVGAA
jgi:hypothetical protein